MITYDDLSDEQKQLIILAKQGRNVLVDACIGSGKTTTIQVLCDEMKDKSILYLTYNRLLKADAKAKIKEDNSLVQNYHGYAYKLLRDSGYETSKTDCVQDFLDFDPNLHGKIDLIVLDEYQDINDDIAKMLTRIKEKCGTVQIVAVGDMCQKLYATTTLRANEFIIGLLDQPEQLQFTKCFRLSKDYAKSLGDAWNKPIEGVNKDCKIECMTFNNVKAFLKKQEASDVLVLGQMKAGSARGKTAVDLLNELETECPKKYNKNTVYAKISDTTDSEVDIDDDAAIFTTYDSSKGLERNICVIFNYTYDYYETRINMPMTEWDILRNIFLVAASRGKSRIIFVTDMDIENDFYKNPDPEYKGKFGYLTSFDEVSQPRNKNIEFHKPFFVSNMFDYKFEEDIQNCMEYLDCVELETFDKSIISVNNKDGLIDLSPCIGIWQEAGYFTDYDIDDQIRQLQEEAGASEFKYEPMKQNPTLDDKIYYATYSATRQIRYIKQTSKFLLASDEKEAIQNRLSEELDRNETVQRGCRIAFADATMTEPLIIDGVCDVLKDNIVWELKFVDDLRTEHYLQCAMYILGLGLEEGILWNVKKNKMISIKITNKDLFFNDVIYAITKQAMGGARISDIYSYTLKDKREVVAKKSPVLSKFKKRHSNVG